MNADGSGADSCAEPPPASGNDRNAAEGDNSVEQAGAARQAEERFIDDLLSRGEAVPEGQPLPPGATHEIVRDDEGRRTARRVRFKAF